MAEPTQLVVVSRGRTEQTIEQRGRTSILHTARRGGFDVLSSCENGHCGSCVARLTEGTVEMRNHEALAPDEVAAGWIVTCQAWPSSPVVRVAFDH